MGDHLIKSIKTSLLGASIAASDRLFVASTRANNALDSFTIDSPELRRKKAAQALVRSDLVFNEGAFKTLAHYPIDGFFNRLQLTPQEEGIECWNAMIASVQRYIHFEISQPLMRYSLNLNSNSKIL